MNPNYFNDERGERGPRGHRGGHMNPEAGSGRGRGGRRDFGPPGFRGRGPRAGRGDVRTAILVLLSEQPMHGYQIIQELSDRTHGIWTASPGSVYPTLQHLEEQGLVTGADSEGRRVFTLTDAGRELLAGRGDRPAPWERVGRGVDPAHGELKEVMQALVAAIRQVSEAGSSEQLTATVALLGETRKSIYKILAEG
jgi:DNA-binding PadR family transcriptional regulator